MKIKVQGFALPTILITSTVLFMVLVTAVSSTVAIRNALNDQHYTQLAELAGEAGTVYAKACLAQNNNGVTWSDEKPLRPNTDCSGNVQPGLSAYVLEQDNLRTYFVVDKPIIGTSNLPVSMVGKGYTEMLRTSNGIAWRVWGGNIAVALSQTVDGTPVGTSIEGYWTIPPDGYLLEDGSAVSRTTYANLFNIIGTMFGTGDGSTTFNLPDSRGRVAVNKSSDTEFNTLGKKYGEKVHTLTIAEMPVHTHIQNSHNHTQNAHNHTQDAHIHPNPVAVTYNGGAAMNRSIFATNSPFWSMADWHNPTASTTATNNAATATNNAATAVNQTAGGGGSHNNIQPSIVKMFAIKY